LAHFTKSSIHKKYYKAKFVVDDHSQNDIIGVLIDVCTALGT